jgi:acyl carrier protein
MDAKAKSIRDFVQDKIRQAAKENWQPVPNNIDDNFNLVESGLFDSLGFIGLLSAIENEFHFTIDPAELESEDLIIVGNLVRAAARFAGNSGDPENARSL